MPTEGGGETQHINAERGTVKWFDRRKGFGFIIGPEGQDIFVHYTKIVGDGYRVLEDGDRVVYSANLTPRGWHATEVQRPASARNPAVRVRAVGHAKADQAHANADRESR